MNVYLVNVISFKGYRQFKIKAESLQEAAEKTREKLDEPYTRFRIREAPP